MQRKHRVSMADIAKETGVSAATVSRALNNHPKVSAEVRAAVLQTADRLGYIRNLGAASLAASRSMTVGLLLRDMSSQFYGGVAAQVQMETDAAGYDLLITIGGDDAESQMNAIRNLLGHDVGGIIVASGRIAEEVMEYSARFVPTVALSSGLDMPSVGSVRIDPKCEADLARRVVVAGHRNVAVTASSNPLASTLHARTATFLTELIVAGAQTLIMSMPVEQGRYLREQVDRALEAKVTAIMAGSDAIAVSIMEYLQELGLSCPDDISVTGFDGVGALRSPLLGLTTVEQPMERLASVAVGMITQYLTSGGSEEPISGTVINQLVMGRFVPGRTLGSPKAV